MTAAPRYRFKCRSCDEWHEGIPGWGWNCPPEYFFLPEEEREARGFLTSDLCVVDDQNFFACGCLELPVPGTGDIMSLRVWVSLSEADFFAFQDLLDVAQRSHHGPFAGRLSVPIPTYPDTQGLSARVRIRDNATRPAIEIEPTDHPLFLEQQRGVGNERIQALFEFFEHRLSVAGDEDASADAQEGAQDDEAAFRCDTHGEAVRALVCGHLFATASSGVAGLSYYFGSDEDSDDDATDATCVWCASCEEMLAREGGWNDASEAFADIHVICESCLAQLLSRHVPGA